MVADESRTDKTICLAVTPSLKAYGIPGRARLFEVKQRLRELNASRPRSRQITFLTAPPRMSYYMEVSGIVFNTYLKYVAPEDIHPYSVDEVFIDATDYLRLYSLSAHDFAMRMIRDVLSTTGITATAGIGTNLYLAKIAMDIEAKHNDPDADGVRIAVLDEATYRRRYWNHRPLTDFWRIGRGLAGKLESVGLFTLGDVARCSLGPGVENLYRLFGVNAELLIDHAWGWEPCTMADIKAYKPSSRSQSRGQVLSRPYSCDEARVVVKEMTDNLVLELVEKHLLTDSIMLDIVYDTVSTQTGESTGRGVVRDYYGRMMPKPSHGSARLTGHSSSTSQICGAMVRLFDDIAEKDLMVRRLYIAFGNTKADDGLDGRQLLLFEDAEATEKERRRQETILAIRRKFGKNAILTGTNFEKGATSIERNNQVGGHRK